MGMLLSCCSRGDEEIAISTQNSKKEKIETQPSVKGDTQEENVPQPKIIDNAADPHIDLLMKCMKIFPGLVEKIKSDNGL